MADDTEKDCGLIFNAADIREKGGLSVSRSLDPGIFAGLLETPNGISDASASLVFSVGGESLLLEGSAKATLKLECARCGEIYTAEFSEAFDELYEDTVEFIDVRGPIRESVALMMPLKPICAADCRGLCPACGGNLNRKPCGCAAESGPSRNGAAGDGPFGALKDISALRQAGKSGKKRRK